MRAMVAIPTYWTRPRDESPKAGDAIFDHPTPVDGESTLPRLLDSLLAAEQVIPFDVLIVTGIAAPDVAARAEARLRDILASYGTAHVALDLLLGKMALPSSSPAFLYVSPVHIHALQDMMAKRGLPREALSDSTYPGVRNVHLIIPYLLNYDVVIALDDDEQIPPDYFHRVKETLIRHSKDGIAGLYLDSDGALHLVDPPRGGNIFLEKIHWMHEALRVLLSPRKRWVPTPIAFGGNMLFPRTLMARVGFDPYVSRGEDIDYVLNALWAGKTFVLDTQLHIKHHPPQAYDTHPYARLAQDVRRFLYEREKVRIMGSTVEKHEDKRRQALEAFIHSPYPGRFLNDDVEHHALEALHALADENSIAQWGTPEAIIADAQHRARALARRYFNFAQAWQMCLHETS